MKKLIIGVLLFSIVSAIFICGCNNKDNEWKTAYIDFIKNEVDDKDANGKEIKYALVYIDDNIPELLYSGEGYVNTHLCWLKNGKVTHQFVCNQDFLYYEKKNLFYGFYFNHGVSHDIVYKLEDDSLTKLFEGTGNFTKNNFEYSINKKIVSKSDYDKELGKHFDKNNATTVNYCSGKEKIIKLIESN